MKEFRMKNKNRFGKILSRLGITFILAAGLLFSYNQYQSWQAGKESSEILNNLQANISELEKDEKLSLEMPTKHFDGYDYIGIIDIPKLAIELPVMAEWDYPRLRIAPCRHYGSTRTNDLVIAAHNYSSHFGKLDTLEIGDEINITEADGRVVRYKLEKMQVMEPTRVEEVLDSDYDLALYTCTLESITRVVAFADEIEVNNEN